MSRSRSLFAIYQRNSFKDFLIVFFLAESGFVVAHYKKFVLHQIHFVGIQCFRQYTHQRKVDFIFFETVDDLCLVGSGKTSLHRLDRLQLDVIVAERLPEVSLGLTINDRLERAAKQ